MASAHDRGSITSTDWDIEDELPTSADQYNPDAYYKIVEVAVSSFSDLEARNGKKYTVYNVETFNRRGDHAVLQRRFNEFAWLRNLVKDDEEIAAFDFPKKALRKDNVNTKENRRARFDLFLKLVVSRVDTFEVQNWLWRTDSHAGAKVFGGNSKVRAFQERPWPVPAPSDEQAIIDLMKRPTPFLKFGRRGIPHWRLFELSQDELSITYQGSKKKLTTPISISGIKGVKLGQSSATFQRVNYRQLEKVSMTVTYGSHREIMGAMAKEDTLDVAARHPDELRIWLLGINILIKRTAELWQSPAPPGGGLRSAPSDASLPDSPTRASLHGVVGSGTSPQNEGKRSEASRGFHRQTSSFSQPTRPPSELRDTTDIGPVAEGAAEDGGGADLDAIDDPGDISAMQNEITVYTSVWAYGSNAWGQLGTEAEPSEDFRTEAPSRVLLEPNTDVRTVACGRDAMILAPRFLEQPFDQHLVLCTGRALTCADAVQHSWTRREHVLMPTPMVGLPHDAAVRAVACGDNHMLMCTTHGELFSSGCNIFGQLGLGHCEDVGLSAVPHMHKVRLVAAGDGTSAAVVDAEPNHKLYTWGCGLRGVLGHGSTDNCPQPRRVHLSENTTEVLQIECGANHMAMVSLDRTEREPGVPASPAVSQHKRSLQSSRVLNPSRGNPARTKLDVSDELDAEVTTALWTWGCGEMGQLGHGDLNDHLVPTRVEALVNKFVRQVACGAAHSVAIVDIQTGGRVLHGQLWTWGLALASQGSATSIAFTSPHYFNFTKQGSQNNVAEQVACGDLFTAVLDEDGNVTVIGLSPETGRETISQITLPREFHNLNSSDYIDVERIVAGGESLAVLAAHRFNISSGLEGVF